MSTLLEHEEAAEAARAPRVRRLPGVVAGYAALALLAYVPPLLTARGRVAADTKQYLYLDPARLMGRVVSMWDPNVGMGTVTHQTIGYVFPLGPYYWTFDTLGLPDWVAQRCWLGSLLFFAGAGVLYLLRTFAVRGPGAVVAALAYMLTPYVLDYAARISVLLMPWAALPWLLGFVRKALRVPPRSGLAAWRYPAIFAIVVQVVGGVNATALIFAGIGPVLWIVYAWLVARDVDFRRALGVTLRTGGLTVLASLWWISGLRMQAAYGLDILRYTETLDAVARTSTPNEVLRGLGYWFFYGQDRLGSWIEAARDYTQHLWVILAGYVLAAAGLLAAGLLRWKHRAYFVAVLVVGVVIAVGAHPFRTPTPLGAVFKAFATNSSAGLAMRSTARAVPLVVLALAIFLGLGTNVVAERLRARGTAWALAVPVVVVVLLLVNFPALYDGTYYGKNLQRPEEVPDYWKEAIAAIGARGNDTRVLEAPGSDFSSYRWGNTVDPITPGLTDRPYLARELIPYGTAGTADLLNALDRRIQEGVADPDAIVPLLRRMGVGEVIARNDIQYERYDLIPPRELARLLGETPGLGEPESYGPAFVWVAAGYHDEVSLSAPPNEPLIAPVVVYPVLDPLPIVRAESRTHGLMVSGDGEGLVDVAGVGLLDGAGVVRYSASYTSPAALRDAVERGAVLVVTDNNRLRARKWTSVKDNLGYTEQPGQLDKALVRDNGDSRLPLFPGQQESASTTTQQVGVRSVAASAYGNTITYTPEDRATRALDGDLRTTWRANAFGDARGQRIRIDLEGPVTTDRVNLVQPLGGFRNRWITDVELRFDGGSPVRATLDDTSRTFVGQTVQFTRRTFSRFEVTVKRTSDGHTNLFGKDDSVGFAEIRLRDERADHDVAVTEIVQMPTDLVEALGPATADYPLVFVMSRYAVRPVPPRSQPERRISRAFVVPTRRSFLLTGNAQVSTEASPADIDAAFGIAGASAGGLTVTSSPTLPGCLRCRADQALDGDALTAWQTPVGDVRGHWAEVTAPAPVTFDHLELRVVADGRHSVPTRLRVEADGDVRVLDLPPVADVPGENGSVPVRLAFPPLAGRTIRVTVEEVREVRSVAFAGNAPPLMPAAIAELGIPGVRLPAAPTRLDSGCRADLVTIDDVPFPVRVTGAAERADDFLGLTVMPCDPADPARVPTVELAAGRHVLRTALRPDVGWSVDRLVLASGTAAAPVAVRDGDVTAVGAPAPPAPNVEVLDSERTSVRVRVSGATEPFWMVLGQSQSPGWRAQVEGRDVGGSELVDGYANGWLVTPPAETFEMTMQWTPQRQVWAALAISVAAVLGCIAIVVLTWRRRVFALANATPAEDAAVSTAFDEPRTFASASLRPLWPAPLLAGLLAAIAVAPWVGLLIAAFAAFLVWQPDLRRYVLVLPAVILVWCGLYIARQQWAFRFPSVFEWPTLFPRARTPAWIAVMILAADVIVQLARRRRPPPTCP